MTIAQIENRACLGLTLATLPGVKVQPFYLAAMDVPDPLDPPSAWKRAVGLSGADSPALDVGGAMGTGEEAGVGEPIFLSYATTQSIDALQDYIAGMDATFPRSQKIGAIASTVSRYMSTRCLVGMNGPVSSHAFLLSVSSHAFLLSVMRCWQLQRGLCLVPRGVCRV